jgi:hypothetical protein
MRQQTLDDLSLNQEIIKAAGELLKSGSYAVSKPVRAGFTTSAIIAAQRAGVPILLLDPTNAILKDTVKKAAKEEISVRVPANIECQILKEKARVHPLLNCVPMPLPDCHECPYMETCTVLDVLKMDTPGLICMTYSKLAAIMHSNSKEAKEILNKLSKQSVIIMDEAHTLSKPAQIAVEANRQVEIPTGYPTLQKIYNRWTNFNDIHTPDIQALLDESDNFTNKCLAKPLPLAPINISDDKPEAWRELREIACNDGMNQADIIDLLNIVTLMNSSSINLLFQHDNETDKKRVLVATGQSDLVATMKDFLHDYGARANHIYVSGTLYEPHAGYFEELSGKEIKPVVFPDFQNANGTFTLVPDRWKLTSWNFTTKLPEIIDTIEAIAEREQQTILVFAPNKSKASMIRQQIKMKGIQDVKVDYYRSSQSMGVESKYRICVAVGMAETPVNSCDAMAQGTDAYQMWLDSGCIRLQGVHADTWQAINRVKDPSGQVPSKAYMIGCRVDQIRELTKWGNNRRIKIADMDIKKDRNGNYYMVRFYKVKVDDLIDPSPISGENQNSDNVSQRELGDYIAGFKDYYNCCRINSEKPDILSIDNSRENIRKFRIYNNPMNKNELDSTVESLQFMFMNRTDAHGGQYKVQGGASWSKVIGSMSDEKMVKHVQGGATFGSYELGLDDTVTWSCLDIDSHEGDRPITGEIIAQTVADVKKVLAVLGKYKVPFLLEASGSQGSYHVWIFHTKTKTYNAYRFIRQLMAEAGIKCEVFPKQKSLKDKNGKYGNLVKIPMCVNQKTGARSVFLNPDTFEPLEGVIKHPGLVRLLEVPEPAKKGKDSLTMPKVSKHVKCDKVDLDPCMRGLIEDKVPLEGSEGHEMRLAIAIKAGMMGLDAEFAANMFKDQRDFDFEYSLKKIKETWEYGYKPYSCETLRDKCSEIVKPYCGNCGRCPA